MQVVRKQRRWIPWAIGSVLVLGVIAVVALIVVRSMILDLQAEDALSKVPAFQQIKRWEPQTYKAIKAEIVTALSNNRAENQAIAHAGTLALAEAKRYMKTASDESVVEFMRSSNEQVRETAAKDPDIAYDLLGGRPDVDVQRYVDPRTEQRIGKAIGEIIRTGVAKEASYQNDARAKQLLEQIKASMHRDYGDDADLPRGIPHYTVQEWEDTVRRRRLSTTDTLEWERQIRLYGKYHPIDRRRTCQMVVEFQDRILALPTEQAASVFRLLFSHV